MVTAIRQLRSDDLDGALRLSSTAGWNQRIDDWRMLLTIAPRGSFVVLDGDRIVGTAIGIDYGGFGWIAMMLVDPAYRGRGLGRGLLEAAMNAVAANRPIRLDATPLGRPLYQSYGFEDEALLSRYVADPATRRTPSEATSGDSRPLAASDLNTLAPRDEIVFGGQRRAVLEWALARAPQYSRGVRTADGSEAYCFGRQGRLFDQIGPIVAPDADSARCLVIAAAPAASGRALVIDAFDRRTDFTNWLGECGFRVERPLFRMCRPPAGGAAFRSGPAPGEFAIFGPEFG
jgi:GNAT superfamily N-acetyltransferase